MFQAYSTTSSFGASRCQQPLSLGNTAAELTYKNSSLGWRGRWLWKSSSSLTPAWVDNLVLLQLQKLVRSMLSSGWLTADDDRAASAATHIFLSSGFFRQMAATASTATCCCCCCCSWCCSSSGPTAFFRSASDRCNRNVSIFPFDRSNDLSLWWLYSRENKANDDDDDDDDNDDDDDDDSRCSRSKYGTIVGNSGFSFMWLFN